MAGFGAGWGWADTTPAPITTAAATIKVLIFIANSPMPDSRPWEAEYCRAVGAVSGRLGPVRIENRM
jgi:hypothetical protein